MINNISLKKNYVQWDNMAKNHASHDARAYYMHDKTLSPTLAARGGIAKVIFCTREEATQHVDENNNLKNDVVIRRLTPNEYWRLMGFTDEEFHKAEAVNSNTQLYKQAGNSIVVNVLVEIFRGLLLS